MWKGRTRAIARPPIAEVNREAACLAAGGRELVNLGQAVVALPPPRGVEQAVQGFLAGGEHHLYSPDPGKPEVLEKVAGFLRRHKGVGEACPERLLLTCGCNQAFVNALLAVTRPGEEVVLFAPYYFDHLFAVHLAGCSPVVVPKAADAGRWRIDLEATRKVITPKTRAVVVVSPGNPCAQVEPRATLEALGELCRKHDAWLICDETYDLLTFPPNEHCCAATLPCRDRTLLVGSFSKSLALAAWRIGYLYASEEVIREAFKVQDALVVCAPVPAQVAVAAALEHVDEYVAEVRRELSARRDALLAELAGIAWLRPGRVEGGTFVLAALPEGTDSARLAVELVRETGVITVPGAAFGEAARSHLRLSFGNQPVGRIREAGRRLRGFRPR